MRILCWGDRKSGSDLVWVGLGSSRRGWDSYLYLLGFPSGHCGKRPWTLSHRLCSSCFWGRPREVFMLAC